MAGGQGADDRSETQIEVRFAADAMLGRLARWLRLFGYDAGYVPGIEDAELIRIARQEGRIILTRDEHFRRRNIPECVFVYSDTVSEQLAQVIRAFGLHPRECRCTSCNGILRPVEKRAVEGLVPDHVYLNFHRFRLCGECGRIYWEGSHYRRLREKLNEIADAAARKD